MVLEEIMTHRKTLMGALAIGYLYWKRDELRQHIKNTFMTYTVISGSPSLASSSTRTDDLYFNLLKLINKLNSPKIHNRTTEIYFQSKYEDDPTADDSILEYKIISIPGFGTHTFWYKGCWFQLQRSDHPSDYLVLSTLKWNRRVLDNLLQFLKEDSEKRREKQISFWYSSPSDKDWHVLGSKRIRPLESVIIKSGLKEKLLKDVQDFLKSKEWYVQRGIPYHRGYLLYGPPGSGKSSLIKAIAGQIKYDICLMSLSSSGLDDDNLNLLMNTAPKESIILLEDIDAAFKSRENLSSCGDEGDPLAYGGMGRSQITFKGLLNAVDGVASADGRVVFITTNYFKKLDPALIRPGRVDVKVLIDYPTEGQIVEMFRRFYDKVGDDKVEKFVKIVLGLKEKVSMASVQSLFIVNKDDPEGAIAGAGEHFADWFSNRNEDYLSNYI